MVHFLNFMSVIFLSRLRNRFIFIIRKTKNARAETCDALALLARRNSNSGESLSARNFMFRKASTDFAVVGKALS